MLGSIFESDVMALSSDAQAAAYSADEQLLLDELDRLDHIARKQCSALATMAALDIRFKPIPCSLIAAAVLYVSRRCLGFPLDEVWCIELELMTHYSVAELSSVVRLLDQASDEITLWAQSGSVAEITTSEPVTPTKSFDEPDSITSIHPSKSAADTTSVSVKKNPKFSFDTNEARAAFKNAGAEDSFVSPTSITAQQVDVGRARPVV